MFPNMRKYLVMRAQDVSSFATHVPFQLGIDNMEKEDVCYKSWKDS